MPTQNPESLLAITKLLKNKGYGVFYTDDCYHVYVIPWKFQSWFSTTSLSDLFEYAKYTHSVNSGPGSNYWKHPK